MGDKKQVNTRRETIFKLLENVQDKELLTPLVDNYLFLEEKLNELRKLPLYRVHPTNKTRQEITAAGKLYKDYMQSYINATKVLQKTLIISGGEDSPLLKALKEFADD